MSERGSLMAGKRGLILGVANDRSLAWGIARAVADQGALVALTYQGEALKKRVVPLAEKLGSPIVEPADVTDSASLAMPCSRWCARSGVVWIFWFMRSVFPTRTSFAGRYLDTSEGNFVNTMLISCYSFTDLARRAAALMSPGGDPC